ncbi:hypothetical protein BTVI_53415 [Pitangus sulphuratus]|nr:hypothetical protein BTVI_53415 [Pitangus sulphuratus]
MGQGLYDGRQVWQQRQGYINLDLGRGQIQRAPTTAALAELRVSDATSWKNRSVRQDGEITLHVTEQLEHIELYPGTDKLFESFWIRIKGQDNTGETVVGIYYRPPDQDEEADEAFYGEVELLNAFLTLIFTAEGNSQESQTSEVREEVWRKEDFALVTEDWVRGWLDRLNDRKSVDPGGMHPQVLRELAGVVTKPQSIIFEKSWRTGKLSNDWRKSNVTPIFKKGKKKNPENYQPVSFTSIPGEVMEQIILEVMTKHVAEKKVIRSSQHGFTKGKSCLTIVITFRDGVAGWVNKGGAVNVVLP